LGAVAGLVSQSNSKRTVSKMRLSLSLILFVLAGAANAAETEAAFLFDALHGKTPYHASWEKLMKFVQPTPDWLAQFNRNFDGVAGQMTNLTIDGKPYEMSFVCKPTDCIGHKFVVLFDANGSHAYGALGGKDNDPAFFGSPTEAEQAAMAKAVRG
jgi:Inhibitor of vertebrate lysozyme (Ivy)